MDGERYCDSQIMLPVFEDAHSIQTMIQRVVQMMLSRRIERKDAGLLLYALQIASGNLKMMQAEKARPTQVVVEPEKAAETPMGMTPWSASGKGHDIEEPADIAAERAVSELNEWWAERYRQQRQRMVEEAKKIEKWFSVGADQYDRPADILDSVRSSLELGVEVMGNRLAENADRLRSEVEVVAGSAG